MNFTAQTNRGSSHTACSYPLGAATGGVFAFSAERMGYHSNPPDYRKAEKSDFQTSSFCRMEYKICVFLLKNHWK